MSSVFRGAAIGFGYSPEMETTLRLAPIVDYAFDLFLREADAGSASAALLDETIRKVLANRGEKSAFAWDPVAMLRDAVAGLEYTLSELEEPLAPVDLEGPMRELEAKITAALETVDSLVATAGLAAAARSKLAEALEHARDGHFKDLLGTSLKTCPVNKPPSKDAAALARYGRIVEEWAMIQASVGRYAVVLGPGILGHRSSGSTLPSSRRSAERAGCAASSISATSSTSCATGSMRARCPTSTFSSARGSAIG